VHKPTPDEFVAKREAKKYLKEEARTEFKKQVESIDARNKAERMQREYDRLRNERKAMDMERLLNERDAEFADEPHPSIVGIPVVSINIPKQAEIIYTPSFKFRVVAASTGTLVGIASNYDEALKMAKKVK
jgi:hypothetical protein